MKILICLDYGKAASIVLKEAQPFVKAFRNAEIYVYNVIDMALIADGCEYTALEAEADELKKMATATFSGGKINFNFESGSPSQQIINYCTQIGCGLLVLGTHGRTGMRHLTMGSVAERVIRNIACNTLVIPIKNKI